MALLQSQCHPARGETAAIVALAEARSLAAGGGGRLIRLGAGLSLHDVGRACGVHASTVLRWERGERRPTSEPAQRYALLMRELANPNGRGPARRTGGDPR